MSIQPLLEAPWVIQVHAFAAVAAFLLGVIQLVAPKGTLPHRTLGIVWIMLIVAVTISSIFVRPSLYPGLPLTKWFSPIHAFTVLTAFGIFGGVSFLLRGGPTLKQHKKPFTGIFIGGLVVAGALSFLPGRIMHQVVFGGG
ncbi:DUF2306 domain-containing protein [Hyphococcus sp.]|uniref:DUF2306 domain-containing protein n=1 Tax=Hyphococcus sp. TaxID=2038636 RepID=UPI0020879CFB|nr:MAG: membrane protein [Marinicaulis sp.]